MTEVAFLSRNNFLLDCNVTFEMTYETFHYSGPWRSVFPIRSVYLLSSLPFMVLFYSSVFFTKWVFLVPKLPAIKLFLSQACKFSSLLNGFNPQNFPADLKSYDNLCACFFSIQSPSMYLSQKTEWIKKQDSVHTFSLSVQKKISLIIIHDCTVFSLYAFFSPFSSWS